MLLGLDNVYTCSLSAIPTFNYLRVEKDSRVKAAAIETSSSCVKNSSMHAMLLSFMHPLVFRL